MFFVLSKTLGFLILPTNLLIGVGVVGAVLMFTRLASLGRKLVIASVLLLVICGLSPLGNWLLYPLEQRFPPWDPSRGAPDGIIVLGGS
ncbi:MAG: YdcF family protein, partial [Bradyrhizobium sp.]